MKNIDQILNKIPISLNLITVIFNVLLFFNVIHFEQPECIIPDEWFYFGVYEITNTIFTITLGIICYRLRFCAYNWVSVVSLFLLNVINLFAIFTEMNIWLYYAATMNIIFVVLTVLSIILYIIEFKKSKEP